MSRSEFTRMAAFTRTAAAGGSRSSVLSTPEVPTIDGADPPRRQSSAPTVAHAVHAPLLVQRGCAPASTIEVQDERANAAVSARILLLPRHLRV